MIYAFRFQAKPEVSHSSISFPPVPLKLVAATSSAPSTTYCSKFEWNAPAVAR
jgi:hypothetical protein